jgi:hypothetical protein
LEDLGVDCKIGSIMKQVLKIGWDGVDWINLFHDTDKWWALLNRVMNLRIP